MINIVASRIIRHDNSTDFQNVVNLMVELSYTRTYTHTHTVALSSEFPPTSHADLNAECFHVSSQSKCSVIRWHSGVSMPISIYHYTILCIKILPTIESIQTNRICLIKRTTHDISGKRFE